jgi:two-component system OmpR family response regulator
VAAKVRGNYAEANRLVDFTNPELLHSKLTGRAPRVGAMTLAPRNGSPEDDRMPRVLVVDDEESITQLVATVLRYEGFEVECAADGRSAVRTARTFQPDLVVLDVMLPDWDGFEVYRRLANETAQIPVLFLTARDAAADRVHGLTLGADDYVGKPFSLEELVARVRAVLRRTRGEEPADTLRYHDLSIDEEAHEVRRGDRIVDLTPTEFHLLRYLLVNAGRVVSKAQILDHVWRYDFNGDASVVETYISYLRKKLDRPGDVALIQTVRGFGYAIRLPKR